RRDGVRRRQLQSIVRVDRARAGPARQPVTPGDSWIPIPADSGFGLDNLPLGIGRRPGGHAHAHVAIGDHALDLAAAAATGLPDTEPVLLNLWYLNSLLREGNDVIDALRHRVAELVTDASVRDRLAGAVARRDELQIGAPVR